MAQSKRDGSSAAMMTVSLRPPQAAAGCGGHQVHMRRPENAGHLVSPSLRAGSLYTYPCQGGEGGGCRRGI